MSTESFVPQSRETEYVDEPMPTPRPWVLDRPGEIANDPRAHYFGAVGPDLGYAGRLVSQFLPMINFPTDLERADVLQAGLALGRRRAGLAARGPIEEDLEVAFMLLGVLGDEPGDWSRAAGKIRALIIGAGHNADIATQMAMLIPQDWIALKPDRLRHRFESEGPSALWG